MCVQLFDGRLAVPCTLWSLPPRLIYVLGRFDELLEYNEYERPLGRSFKMIERNALLLADVGWTQASRVIPVVRDREALSRTVTHALLPLNNKAPPYRPAVVHVALRIVPLLPLPEASTTVVPAPSPKL